MQILYEDDALLIVNKPNKMMVYPTLLAKNCHWFATKELEKLGYLNLYTVHRLDRPTSGLLLFAKDKEIAKEISILFSENKVNKTYLCLVRGFTDLEGSIEKELKKEGEGKLQKALTHYKSLQQQTVAIEISKYPQSRFSLLEVKPVTGRMHQIRRHLAHLRHPIIGDVRYGDRHYNHYMKEQLDCENLLLHAYKMEFMHPVSGELIEITAPLPEEFKIVLKLFNFSMEQVLLRNED